MKWNFTGLMVFMILACAPGESETSRASADRSAVIAASEEYRRAWIQGDTALALARVSDDIRIFLSKAPDIVGKDGARELFAREMATYKIPSLTINRQDLFLSGDYAVDIGTYEETLVPKTGPQINAAGRYMTLWRREAGGGGQWRIIRFMLNEAK